MSRRSCVDHGGRRSRHRRPAPPRGASRPAARPLQQGRDVADGSTRRRRGRDGERAQIRPLAISPATVFMPIAVKSTSLDATALNIAPTSLNGTCSMRTSAARAQRLDRDMAGVAVAERRVADAAGLRRAASSSAAMLPKRLAPPTQSRKVARNSSVSGTRSLHRVVGQRRVQQRIDGERRRVGEEQRVAVGRRAPHVGEGDDSRGARLVVDQDRLVPLPRQPLGDAARDDVGADPDGVRHDDADRTIRKRRAACRGRVQGREGGAQAGGEDGAATRAVLAAERRDGRKDRACGRPRQGVGEMRSAQSVCIDFGAGCATSRRTCRHAGRRPPARGFP